jgi:hypothetical protein
MPPSDYTKLEVVGEVMHETDKAYLFRPTELAGDEEDVWLPKSQCEWVEGMMLVPMWLAEEKGLV